MLGGGSGEETTVLTNYRKQNGYQYDWSYMLARDNLLESIIIEDRGKIGKHPRRRGVYGKSAREWK